MMQVWVWLLTCVALCAGQDRPLVQVNEGLIRGLNTTAFDRTYLEFLSIPYARPPVGPLRFKDPQPVDPWEGELDASQLPPSCDQRLQGTEDCLFLNIYTPEDALSTPDPLPVMVFIHGGYFYSGGSELYHGFQELVARGVIAVMLQYRLGVLGFLSTEDDAAPGNQGLKDQTLALQWINSNIAAFGGDVDRITVFGESAGAISIHYQMMAPSAAGLFSGAIMESGTGIIPWSQGRDFLWTAQTIAERLNCPTEPSDALVECLQGKNQHLLDAEFWTFTEWNLQPMYFAPRVDGVYVPDHPARLLQEGRYHHVPTIMGVNRDEGAVESTPMFAFPSLVDKLLTNFTHYGPISLALYPDEDPINTATNLYDYYVGGLNLDREHYDNLTRLFSHAKFQVYEDWTLQLMSDQVPVYAYELHHRGEHSFTEIYLTDGLDLPEADSSVCHGDDVQYLFNPFLSNLTQPEDVIVSDIFLTTWTNFAKTRNPTPDASLGFEWSLSDSSSLQYLKILPQPYMESDQRADVRAMWETLPLRINDLLNH